jgi:hypothetical protein
MADCNVTNCDLNYCDIPPQLCHLKPGQVYALLAILQNSKFITDVAGTTKMARAYFNDYKYWCQNISFNSIKGYHGKSLRLILHPTYTCNYDSKKICGSNLNRILITGPQTKKESIFYYYYKNHNFFIRILTALKWAVKSFNDDKYYCKVIELPREFDWGLQNKDLKFRITSRDIMSLYGYVWPCPTKFPNCKHDSWGMHTVACPKKLYTTIQGARGNAQPTWYLPMPMSKFIINKVQCNQHIYGLPDAIGNSKYRDVYECSSRHGCR